MKHHKFSRLRRKMAPARQAKNAKAARKMMAQILLSELRRRLMMCVLAFIAATGACYFVAADIYAFLVAPLAD